MRIPVKLPQFGESAAEATVMAWLSLLEPRSLPNNSQGETILQKTPFWSGGAMLQFGF